MRISSQFIGLDTDSWYSKSKSVWRVSSPSTWICTFMPSVAGTEVSSVGGMSLLGWMLWSGCEVA